MADKKISELTGAGVLDGTEPFPLVQGGATKKALVSAVATYVASTLGSAAALIADTDTALTANSDARVATQKATKAYVDTAVTGLLDFKGSTNASGNPNYPAASKGDAYVVSAAGKIGGASGKSVDVGDVFVASADNAGGTEAAVGSSWFVLEHNLAGALLAANNLSDLASAATARTNLGLAAIAASGLATDLTGTLDPARLPNFNAGTMQFNIVISGMYIDTGPIPNAVTAAGVANRMQIHPWMPSRDVVISNIGVEVTTAAASSNAKVVVYDSDNSTGGPGALIKETGNLDCSTTGVKSEAWSYTFLKGHLYWVGVRTSGTQTLRAYNAAQTIAIGRAAAAGGSSNVLQVTLTFATAATSPWGAMSTAQLANASPYSVIMQLA